MFLSNWEILVGSNVVLFGGHTLWRISIRTSIYLYLSKFLFLFLYGIYIIIYLIFIYLFIMTCILDI